MGKLYDFQEEMKKRNTVAITETQDAIQVSMKQSILCIYYGIKEKKQNKLINAITNFFKSKGHSPITEIEEITEKEVKDFIAHYMSRCVNEKFLEEQCEKIWQELQNKIQNNEIFQFVFSEGNINDSKSPYTFVASKFFRLKNL